MLFLLAGTDMSTIENNDELASLIADIEKHFANVTPPSADNIAECQNDWEIEEITRTFAGRDWRDLDRETVESNPVLSLFTPEAFHYFLPAYLRYSIDGPFSYSGLLVDTVNRLLPGKETAGSSGLYRDRLRPFNEDQMNTVIKFLDWVRNHPDGYRLYKNIDRGKPRLMKYFRESR